MRCERTAALLSASVCVCAGIGDAWATADTDFDLSRHAIPPSAIVSGAPRRDAIPALNSPAFLSAEQAAEQLKDDDRVIGVFAGGVSKAYPIAVLNWHEIVNDTIGGADVAVSFCPLTDSAVVFARDGLTTAASGTGGDRPSTTFGVSGLLYQSNLLLYDRDTDSLWSQLRGDAVAGPRTGERLRRVPSALTTWSRWRERHPETLVLSKRTGHVRDYDRSPYPHYDRTAAILFPIQHRDARLAPKRRVLGVTASGRARAYPLDELERSALPLRDDLGGVAVRIDDTSGAVAVESNGRAEGVTAFWFAWAAMHPDTEIWSASGTVAERSERATSDARLSDVAHTWQKLQGMFLGMASPTDDPRSEDSVLVLTGNVTNISTDAIDYVLLRADLLDGDGASLYHEEGYNRRAEKLLDGPSEAGAIQAIEPGETDSFRMLFFGEELPPFASYRVSVAEIR